MWIKICGNTNLEDAQLAAQLGADAVGFIFAASKRQVTAAQVAAMAEGLPDNVERVGVFDSHNAQQIARAAQDANLNAVQLHGGFDQDLLLALAPMVSAMGIRIIQTLHWAADPQPNDADASSSADQIASQLARIAAIGIAGRVLVDSRIGTSPRGGTGVAFDWSAARTLFASAPTGLNLIVAGGLKADNVAHAIAELAPWGVDVSSGVEASVGQKDPAKLARFIQNARSTTATAG